MNEILELFKQLQRLILYNPLKIRLTLYRWIETNPEGLEVFKKLVRECQEPGDQDGKE